MAYSKTDWTDNTSPYINATNLDKMETGIDEAHEAIENTSTGHDHDGTDSKKVDGSNVVNTPAGGIVSTDVQAAITELDTEKESTATSHAARHVTGGGDTIADAVAAGNAGLMSGSDKTKLDAMVSGTATISSGNTTVVISHNIGVTPYINVTPTNEYGIGFWVDTKTNTQFTINLQVPQPSDATFDWSVMA